MCIPLAVSFSGTLATTKAQLNSTSGMPLLGQPSFCLKVTSSLVLFPFKTQDDLTVKRRLHPAVYLLWSLYSSLSVIDSFLPFFLVIPCSLIDLTDISSLQGPRFTAAGSPASQLHTGRTNSHPSLPTFYLSKLTSRGRRMFETKLVGSTQ